MLVLTQRTFRKKATKKSNKKSDWKKKGKKKEKKIPGTSSVYVFPVLQTSSRDRDSSRLMSSFEVTENSVDMHCTLPSLIGQTSLTTTVLTLDTLVFDKSLLLKALYANCLQNMLIRLKRRFSTRYAGTHRRARNACHKKKKIIHRLNWSTKQWKHSWKIPCFSTEKKEEACLCLWFIFHFLSTKLIHSPLSRQKLSTQTNNVK